MSRTLTTGLALAALLGLHQAAIAAHGSSVPSGPSDSSSMQDASPQDQARDSYNSGIDHRDKARKLEAQAGTQSAKDHDKTMDKAKDEYTKALKDFTKAASLDPTMYQALNGMGYTYRKTGDYVKALQMYDQALKMAPGFSDATEYRGEAYLALNRVEDAKLAYMTLFATDRKNADELLQAMSAWVGMRQTDPGTVDSATVASFDAWVKDRAKIASTTSAMALSDSRSVWK